jgi:hypothetical protein
MSWGKRNQKNKEANLKIFGSEKKAREAMKKNSEVSDRNPPMKEHEHPYWSGKDNS